MLSVRVSLSLPPGLEAPEPEPALTRRCISAWPLPHAQWTVVATYPFLPLLLTTK